MFLGKGCSISGHVSGLTVIGEFKKVYPQAKVIGVEPLIEKKKSEPWKFDGGSFGVS